MCRLAHDRIQPERKDDLFIQGDMFSMDFPDRSFELVFNSGVLEHYRSDEIIRALKEMSRICKESGEIVIAIPNHYCIVYRLAYLRGMLLDRLNIRRWPWPPEHKIYDLKYEVEKAGMVLEKRITLSKDSIWSWWQGGKYALVRAAFRLIDRIKPIEGYLSVLIIRKKL